MGWMAQQLRAQTALAWFPGAMRESSQQPVTPDPDATYLGPMGTCTYMYIHPHPLRHIHIVKINPKEFKIKT